MLSSLKRFIAVNVIDRAVGLLPASIKTHLATHALHHESLAHALNREALAAIYLRGMGLEIGAFDQPQAVLADVTVKYVDFKPLEELRKLNPDANITPPDIVTDGEKLPDVPDESQDFVIANHFLEHCIDPLGAIENFLRVVKPNGVVFLAIPDKRFIFDAVRPVTPFEHLLKDYREGGEWSRYGHFEEGARLILGITDEKQIRRNMEEFGHTHYHVWTQIEIMEMVVRLRKELAFDFEVEIFFRHGPFEAILIIRKGSAKMSDEEVMSVVQEQRDVYRKMYPDFKF